MTTRSFEISSFQEEASTWLSPASEVGAALACHPTNKHDDNRCIESAAPKQIQHAIAEMPIVREKKKHASENEAATWLWAQKQTKNLNSGVKVRGRCILTWVTATLCCSRCIHAPSVRPVTATLHYGNLHTMRRL